MKKNRPLTRRLVQGGLTALAVLASLICLCLLMLSLPPGERFLQGILESQLSDVLGQDVVLDGFETNVFTRIRIRGLRILPRNAAIAEPVADITDLNIDYTLARIWRGEWHVRAVQIDSAAIMVRRDSTGSYNLALMNPVPAAETDTSTASFSLRIDSITVEAIDAGYRDGSLNVEAYLRDGAIAVSSDDAGGYRFGLSVDSLEAAYAGIPIGGSNLVVRARLDSAGIILDSVHADLEGLRLVAGAAIPADTAGELNGNLFLRGNPQALLIRAGEQFQWPPVTCGAEIETAITLAGTVGAPAMAARLSMPDISIGPIHAETAAAHVRWQRDSLFIDSLGLAAFDGTVTAKAAMAFDSLVSAELDMRMENIDIADVWNRIHGEPSPYTGRLEGGVSAVGHGKDIRDWQAEALMRTRRAQYETSAVPDLSLSLALSEGRARLMAEQDDFTIRASAGITEDSLRGDFSIDIVRLAPLAGLLDISGLEGAVRASGVISGIRRSPEIEAGITAGRITYRNVPLDTLYGRVRVRDSGVVIHNLRFSGGVAAIDPTSAPFYLDSLAGGFHYEGSVSGRPDSLDGHVGVRLDRLEYAGYSLDSGRVDVVFRGRRALLERAAFYVDSLLLSAEGGYDLVSAEGNLSAGLFEVSRALWDTAVPDHNGDTGLSSPGQRLIGRFISSFDIADTTRMTADIEADVFDFSELAALIPDSLEVHGSFHADLGFAGTVTDPQVELAAQARDIQYGATRLDSILITASLVNDSLQIHTFESFGYGHAMAAEGGMQLMRDSAGLLEISAENVVYGSARIDNISLDVFQPFLEDPLRLSGRASLEAHWDGTLAAPHLFGWIAVDGAVFSLDPETETIRNFNLRGVFEDSLFSVEHAGGEVLGQSFGIGGTVAVRDRQRAMLDLDLSLAGNETIALEGDLWPDSLGIAVTVTRLELATARPFLPNIDSLAGMLTARITINGSPATPRVIGTVNIHGLAVTPQTPDFPVTGGMVAISFNDQAVMVDTIFMKVGEGEVFLSGRLSHTRWDITDVSMICVADNVKLVSPKEYSIHIKSAELSYSRQTDYYRLAGDVFMGESRLTANFRPQSILPWARSVETTELELPPLLQQTRLDVRLRESEDLWMDNNLAHIRLHPELGIIGSMSQPNLSGRVTIEEGYLLYLDRKFKITEGTVDFFDPLRFNPDINLRAETRVTSYRATMATPYLVVFAVEGLLDEAVVSLYAEPPLDKSDIVALLTLGATRSQLAGSDAEGGEGGVTNVLFDRAKMLSSRKVSGYVSGKIGSLMGLDQVTVEGNLFNFDKSWGPQVLASKRFSDRVELTYSTTVGHMNEQSVQLGYQLSRRFSLEGRTDQRGRSSIDIKYGLRFR